MKITTIVSNRKIDPHHANDLVYEWEDELCAYFQAPLSFNHPWKNQRYSKYLPFVLNWLQTNQPAFAYEMCTMRHNGNNKGNIIPCIIDFYIREPWKVRLWYAQYWRNKVICVSSREVYEYLHGLGLSKIRHLPLSISNKYALAEGTQYEKKFDLFIAGRQNPILKQYLTRYLAEHPDITFVRRDFKDGAAIYVNEKNEIVSPTDSREIYISLIRQARACLYSTPGIDGSRNTNGYSQVTPHFLEIIAAGCHPLLRYPDNADTRYYELPSFCPHLETYEQFAAALDRARTTDVDWEKHREYMQKHYTSSVAKQLEQIIAEL